MTTLTDADREELDAERDRAAKQAVAGLRSAVAEALKMLGHARRHLGTLIDELYDVEYAEGADGEDLSAHLDASAEQLRAARRAVECIEAAAAR